MIFGIGDVRFKDIDWKSPEGTVRARVNLSKFGGRFKEAQIWLDNRINLGMMPYIPFRTGRLQGAINQRNSVYRGTGRVVAYTLSYGRHLYGGVNVKSGRPIHYTNPLTTPKWFDTVRAVHENEWKRGVKEIILRK